MLNKIFLLTLSCMCFVGLINTQTYALTLPIVSPSIAAVSSSECLVQTRAPTLDPVTGQMVDCHGAPLWDNSTFVPDHASPTLVSPTAQEIEQEKVHRQNLQKQLNDMNKILESDPGTLRKFELNL
jgi:hypothetical protein